MSRFHQYIEHQGNVHKRYVKTRISVLSGRRPKPNELSVVVPFILSTPEENIKYHITEIDNNPYYEVVGHTPNFNYDEEVLETYSPEEDRIFRAFNKKLFESGLLVEYTENSTPIQYNNALTDVEIQEIAKIKNTLKYRKRLTEITSIPTLERIKAELLELDRPQSFIRATGDRIDELSTNSRSN